MNGTDELPPDHFWDSEQAKKEYYRVEWGIAEAEARLEQAHRRLLTVQAVDDRFAGMPGVFHVVHRSSWHREEDILNLLNQALNPYWLPDKNGKFDSDYYHSRIPSYSRSHTPWQGCLVVQKVESEPVKATVHFGREKKRTGAYVHLKIEYSYTQWVGWYTPTGDVVMSELERSLRTAAYPFLSQNSLYDKLMAEVKQEVYALLAPLSREVVLKFIPDLGPSNIDEIHLSSGIYKEDVPKLEWPPLARYEAPKASKRYGLTSYEGICWICCGRWELYRFPTETLRNVRERITRIVDRLRERITDAARAVVAVEEEIAALRRRQDKVRILHYISLIYREFWSLSGGSAQRSIDAPASAGRVQIPQQAQSLSAKEN